MAYRVATAVKFDPSFDRGESAFMAFWQSFMGDRLDMNKALWKARLAAASPETRRKLEKGYEDRIQKLVKLKGDIEKAVASGNQEALKQHYQLLGKMYTADAGIAKTTISSLAGLSGETQKTYNAYNAVRITPLHKEIYRELINAVANPDQIGKEKITNEVGTWWEKARSTTGSEIEEDKVADGMWKAIQSSGMDEGRKKAVQQALGTVVTDVTDLEYSAIAIPNKIRHYYGLEALGELTPHQEHTITKHGARLKGTLPGLGGAGGVSPQVQTAVQTIDTQIKRLQDQLATTRAEGEVSASEYKELLRGPRTNLALSPFARKPSRLSEPMRRFKQLYTEDQPYAERLLDEDALGKRKLPPKYEELEAPELRYGTFASGGTGSLDKMLRDKVAEYDAAEEGDRAAVGRRLLTEIHQVIGSRESGGRNLFGDTESLIDQTYGKIIGATVEDPRGAGTMRQMVEGGVKRLAEEDLEEKFKDRVGKKTMELIRGALGTPAAGEEAAQMKQWNTQLGQSLFPKLQRASDSYNASDPSQFYDSVSELYEDLAMAPEDLRGDAGQAVISEIDAFQTTHKNPRLLASRLGEIGGQVAGHFAQSPLEGR